MNYRIAEVRRQNDHTQFYPEEKQDGSNIWRRVFDARYHDVYLWFTTLEEARSFLSVRKRVNDTIKPIYHNYP